MVTGFTTAQTFQGAKQQDSQGLDTFGVLVNTKGAVLSSILLAGNDNIHPQAVALDPGATP